MAPPTDVLEANALYAQEIAALRQKCKDDLFFLGSEVLGYDYLYAPADFHRDAVALLGSDFMLLAPRNHIKTTLVDVVGTIHHLLRYPDDRVLIAASTWDNARLVLREIVSHFRDNVTFRRLFPEYVPQKKEEEGNTEEFTVPCRVRHRKEASIETTGQDRVITGRHYDVIRCTDLVVRENVPPAAQPEQMKRTIEWFRTTAALLDTTNLRAHRTIDGTRWHDSDLYGEIIRNSKDPKSPYAHFKKIIIGIKEDAQGDPIPVWDKMPKETLLRLRAEAGAALWASNYKNDPVAGDGIGFRPEWFHPYTEIPEVIEVAITVDLAISDKPGADRTAIVVSGVTPNRRLYVLAMRVGRFTPYETLEHLYALDLEWMPSWVGVESTAWQKAMLYIIHEESIRRNHMLPIRALVADQRKDRRASILCAIAERSGIYVRPEHQELVEECCRFPVGMHDDLVDALAYRVQGFLAPGIADEIPPSLTAAPSSARMTGTQLLESIENERMERNALPWELYEE